MLELIARRLTKRSLCAVRAHFSRPYARLSPAFATRKRQLQTLRRGLEGLGWACPALVDTGTVLRFAQPRSQSRKRLVEVEGGAGLLANTNAEKVGWSERVGFADRHSWLLLVVNAAELLVERRFLVVEKYSVSEARHMRIKKVEVPSIFRYRRAQG